MTTAAPRLYPHMWSWDAAFVAIGLATAVASPRAVAELETLLAAQWRTGMLPHIVFSDRRRRLLPRARALGRRGAAAARARRACARRASASRRCTRSRCGASWTRGRGRRRRGATWPRRSRAEPFAAGWPGTGGWPRRRDPDGARPARDLHGWESGMDNSPRWDAPYAGGGARARPAAVRAPRPRPWSADGGSARPTASTTATCGWSRRCARSATTTTRSRDASSFRVARRVRHRDLRAGQRGARRDRRGAAAGVPRPPSCAAGPTGSGPGWPPPCDPDTGLARDQDLRAGTLDCGPRRIAGFAPLLCGGLDAGAGEHRHAGDLLHRPALVRAPGRSFAAVPPSASPGRPAASGRASTGAARCGR